MSFNKNKAMERGRYMRSIKTYADNGHPLPVTQKIILGYVFFKIIRVRA